MEGGGGVLRPESRLLVERPEGQTESRLHTLQSRNSQKGGGVEKSGLIQTFSEENIMNPSLPTFPHLGYDTYCAMLTVISDKL